MIVKKIFDAGKTPYPTRLRKLIRYIGCPETEDAREKCIHFRGLNFVSQREETRALEMESLLFGRGGGGTGINKPVEHWLLSWGEMEIPTPSQADRAVEIFLDKMGFAKHQVIYGLHANTDNLHVHMALSRYDPESGKLSKYYNDVYRAHKALAFIEHDGNWAPNPNPLYKLNSMGEIERNPDHAWKRKNFAFASPVPLFLSYSSKKESRPPKLPGFSPNVIESDPDRIWYVAEGDDEASFLWDENKLWAFNWANRDNLEILMAAASAADVEIVMQRDLVEFMRSTVEKAGLRCRVRGTESFPPLPRLSFSAAPFKDIGSVFRKLRDEKLTEGEERSRAESMSAMELRALGYSKQQVFVSLALHGRDRDQRYASRITTWAFGPRGDIALLRRGFNLGRWHQSIQNIPKPRKDTRKMLIDSSGRLRMNGKLYNQRDQRADWLREKEMLKFRWEPLASKSQQDHRQRFTRKFW